MAIQLSDPHGVSRVELLWGGKEKKQKLLKLIELELN